MKLLPLVLASLGLGMALAQPPVKKGQTSAAEQEIMKIRRDWYDAFFRGDTATMNGIETDDFVVVSERYSRNKSEQLAQIQKAVKEDKWMPKGVTLVDEHLDVRLHGDTAVLSGVSWNKQPGQENAPVEGKTTSTEVWVKRDGRWQVMHLHYSSWNPEPLTQPSP